MTTRLSPALFTVLSKRASLSRSKTLMDMLVLEFGRCDTNDRDPWNEEEKASTVARAANAAMHRCTRRVMVAR
jgi:hypothetical protein